MGWWLVCRYIGGVSKKAVQVEWVVLLVYKDLIWHESKDLWNRSKICHASKILGWSKCGCPNVEPFPPRKMGGLLYLALRDHQFLHPSVWMGGLSQFAIKESKSI